MELTTSRAADLFLASLRTRSAPANTIKAYRLDLQQFLKQAPEDLSEVTADVIRVFLDSHEQHKPATRRRHAATLRAFYAWLIQQGLVQSNPMERLEPIGQIERLPRPLDPDINAKVYLTQERQGRIDPPRTEPYPCVYQRHKEERPNDKEWDHSHDTRIANTREVHPRDRAHPGHSPQHGAP